MTAADLAIADLAQENAELRERLVAYRMLAQEGIGVIRALEQRHKQQQGTTEALRDECRRYARSAVES